MFGDWTGGCGGCSKVRGAGEIEIVRPQRPQDDKRAPQAIQLTAISVHGIPFTFFNAATSCSCIPS
jgi:hypothetical protein